MPGLLKRAQAVYRTAKGFGANAYKTAHEIAPGVHKAVTAARHGYEKANQLGLIDKYGGEHAADIHRTARRGFSTYDQLSRAAQNVDADFQRMRG